jgi:hypothetical protein
VNLHLSLLLITNASPSRSKIPVFSLPLIQRIVETTLLEETESGEPPAIIKSDIKRVKVLLLTNSTLFIIEYKFCVGVYCIIISGLAIAQIKVPSR